MDKVFDALDPRLNEVIKELRRCNESAILRSADGSSVCIVQDIFVVQTYIEDDGEQGITITMAKDADQAGVIFEELAQDIDEEERVI